MNASHIVNASLRGTLDDTGAAKWTDAELWAFLADGVRYTQVNHPESRIQPDGKQAAILEGVYSAGSDVVALDPIYAEPLREYVLWRAFSADKGDAADKRRAEQHEASFKAWFAPQGA